MLVRCLRFFIAMLLAGFMLAPQWAAADDVDQFARRDFFRQVTLSPDGRFLAATVPTGDRTGLVVLRREGNDRVAAVQLGRGMHIGNFDWVSPTQIAFSVNQRFGALEQPQSTGELMLLDVNTGRSEMVIGQRVESSGPGSRVRQQQPENVAADVIDPLPLDPLHMLVAITPLGNSEQYSRVERMNLQSKRRTLVVRAPVPRADFTTDNTGEVRFARGRLSDNISKLYYRAGERSEWRLVNDEAVSGNREYPLGFSDDNRTAYLQVEQPDRPDLVVAWDTESGTRRTVVADDAVDPALTLTRFGSSQAPVGVRYWNGVPRHVFFDDNSAEARAYRMLEQAFPGQSVRVASTTSDGNTALVFVDDDRSPGDYFLFDLPTRHAQLLLSRRDWIDPEKMSPMRSVVIPARDGTKLHGFVTVPQGHAAQPLPMVVWVHGGPYGIFDRWEFDETVQLLANAGFAVLQVNFRGSGNHGRAYMEAGARQWGRLMQDDVTDATRWAISERIADPGRICIGGASYGAYSALMGVARESAMYRCAVGVVGVYDLPMMQSTDSRVARWLGNWSRDWVGNDREQLAAVSPNRLAGQIKAPVLLVAGGRDETAPIEHSRMMERALGQAGVPVETLYFPNEGHGFYNEDNQRQYFTRMLAFLRQHLGTRSGG